MIRAGPIALLPALLAAAAPGGQRLTPTPAPAATPTATTPVMPQADPRVPAALAAVAHGRYLEATDTLAAAAFGPDGKPRDDFAFEMWQQISPFVTGELDPAVLDRADATAPDPSWAPRLAAAVPHDAIAQIVRRARDTRIVILNEAHDSPRDRAFALDVARALRPLGFTVLAAESLGNEPAEAGKPTPAERLRQDGFARLSTGFYARDPVYAGFLREAMRLGYTPAAYEQTGKQRPPGGGVPAREQAEAENLSAILKAQPAAKVLVYVGYSHVAEEPIASRGGQESWMAARLKRMTGIDPLTIDQTSVADVSFHGRAAWAVAAARIGDRPAVFLAGGEPLVLGDYAGAVDLQVVHPRRAYRYGRPAWLATLGGEPRPVPRELLPRSGRRLVQAFAADAPADAVPLDQLVVQAGVPAPMLMLPPGPVRFATQP